MQMLEGEAREFDEGPGLLQSAWRYKWLIAVAALLGGLLGYGWQARQPTLYEASTRLLMSISSGVLPGDPAAPPQEPKRFLKNQAEVITSRPVLQRAAKGRTTLGGLSGSMTVEVADDADVITIRVRAATAEGAANLAQAVGTAYNDFVIAQSSKAAATEVKQLEATADELNVQLDKVAVALQAKPSDPILQARQAALRDRLNSTVAQSERLEFRAEHGFSPVQWQEPAAVPQQPVQPAPRRGAMAGLLLGLVGSAALAWWLNSRAANQRETERERRDEGGTRPAIAAVRSDSPLEEQPAEGWTDTVPAAGNGGRLGPIAKFVWPGNRQAFLRQDDNRVSAMDGRPTAADVLAVDGEDLRSIFDRLEATLNSEPLDWCLDNLPQLMASQLTMTVYADMAAILLDNADGSLATAGGFGLTAEEQGASVDQSHEALRRALADGLGIFHDGTQSPPAAAAGLPGSQSTGALVMVPLVKGSSWLGMLFVGRRSTNGHRVASFNDQEVERIIRYAMEIAPMAQMLVLLDRLQGSVRSLEMSPDDHAEPAAG